MREISKHVCGIILKLQPPELVSEDLAANRYWTESELAPLPWHEEAPDRRIGLPVFNLHQSIVDALAPAMPLKAIFAGIRR